MLLNRHIRLFTFLVISFGFTGLSSAQSSDAKESLLQKAGEYFNQAKEKEALNTYLKVLELEQDHYEALWHTSLLYARIGYRMDSQEQMEEYYHKALEYAEQTLKNYPQKGHSHFVYAVAHGRLSDIAKSKVRVDKSHIIIEHAEKAVEIIPYYAPAWHLLGIWHSEVANLGATQKLMARFFSQGLPEGASNSKAEAYIQKAIELDPDQTLRFKLDLARHYNRADETEKAIQTLEEVINIEPQNEIDEWNLKRAKELFKELS